ncbi:THUMP-like domain-containing protein [Robertkochia aurantiaca]|uniref:THUMP-like domain-containing protein n=1 Tax=Robertkochia aurantiaca TaxID=2873700 RepID=UPI001CC92375|nr:class I SAM-dependent methyltransferase [Robertkochia sp. 3YJGBD-33]
MNSRISDPDVQRFIKEHLHDDPGQLALKGIGLKGVSDREVLQQITAKQKALDKLPLWARTEGIIYPEKISVEQTSSEQTARYKSQLLPYEQVIDLTGGFGIDSYFFSLLAKKVIHCEINTELSKIARHNFQKLGATNIECHTGDGLEFLKINNRIFDLIYADPARRDRSKKKVFMLEDCLPDIAATLPGLFDHGEAVMVKTSPLLDLQAGIESFRFVNSIHIISLKNEVKELLWILKKDAGTDPLVHAMNIHNEQTDPLTFRLSEEAQSTANFSAPLKYLYEPNAAVMKSGCFTLLTHKFDCYKLHSHTHLYTSSKPVEFPGRSFLIERILPYNKKLLKKDAELQKANITIRNFPDTVNQIRKKTGIKEGGEKYLFFCTDLQGKKIVIVCSKYP